MKIQILNEQLKQVPFAVLNGEHLDEHNLIDIAFYIYLNPEQELDVLRVCLNEEDTKYLEGTGWNIKQLADKVMRQCKNVVEANKNAKEDDYWFDAGFKYPNLDGEVVTFVAMK